MTVDEESAEVRRLLALLAQDERPTEDERRRMRAAMVAAAATGGRSQSPIRLDHDRPEDDLDVVELAVDVDRELELVEWPPVRRRGRFVAPALAAACALALAGLVALIVGVTRPSSPPADDPRVEIQLGGAEVSFSFSESATLDELGDDVISYRATEFVSPFGSSSGSRLGVVTVARPRTLFDDLEPDVFFAANSLETYPAPAIVGGVRVPAWNVTIPGAERERRGCGSTGPCVEFAQLGSGGTLSMEAGLLSRIVLVPLDDGTELVVHMHHVGPPQGSSQDEISRLRDQILTSLVVG